MIFICFMYKLVFYSSANLVDITINSNSENDRFNGNGSVFNNDN
jgi:hypothetical protein